ncbi:MAG TPA: hypothetical protein VME44_22000 [Streptosporangiaceae bacterium]|nr:hypothetical protein [Streptosporangiaceae bacterium]
MADLAAAGFRKSSRAELITSLVVAVGVAVTGTWPMCCGWNGEKPKNSPSAALGLEPEPRARPGKPHRRTHHDHHQHRQHIARRHSARPA